MTFYWAAAFSTCIYLTIKETGGSLNPMVTLGINFAQLIKGEKTLAFKYIYVYALMPFAGSLLAYLFFICVYVKTAQLKH